MADVKGESQPAAEPVAKEPHRLSLAELLLWTSTTAIVLAVLVDYLPARPRQESGGPIMAAPRLPVARAVAYAAAPVYGAALAALVLSFWNLTASRRTFPTQPGHWLLLMAAATPLAVGTQWLLGASSEYDAWATVAALIYVALLSAAAESRFQEPKSWHLFFILGSAGLAVVSLLFVAIAQHGAVAIVGVGYVFGGSALLAVGSSAGIALVAALSDWWDKVPRDGLHWIGIVVFLIAATHGAALAARLAR